MRTLAAMLLLAVLAGGCAADPKAITREDLQLQARRTEEMNREAAAEAKVSRELIVSMLQYMVQYLGSLSRALDAIEANLEARPSSCPPRILPPIRSAPDPGAP